MTTCNLAITKLVKLYRDHFDCESEFLDWGFNLHEYMSFTVWLN